MSIGPKQADDCRSYTKQHLERGKLIFDVLARVFGKTIDHGMDEKCVVASAGERWFRCVLTCPIEINCICISIMTFRDDVELV